MSYTIEHRPAPKTGYHTPAEAKAYYGKYSRNALTVHHWDSPTRVADSDHDNIVNYILGKAAKGIGSVNYVVSNKKITQLVDAANVAWASQSGNPISISIEFSPHLNDEGYRKAGWLINELDKRFGTTLALYPHHKFYPTQCPGSLNLTRMRNEANKWKNAPAPTKPSNGDIEMIKTADAARKAYFLLRGSRPVKDSEINGTAGRRSYEEFVNTGQKEAQAHDQHRKDLERQVGDLADQISAAKSSEAKAKEKTAELELAIRQIKIDLQQANDKAPEVIIKEVEKVVEKCEVDVPPTKPKTPFWVKILALLFKKPH